MTLSINRSRSPKYPNFHLGNAVRQIGKIHAADRRNVIERLNAAKHMGYSGLNGPSEKAIGTLVQYGLLEIVAKGQVRVSQLAVDILHPVTEASRKAALAEAAFNPEIFKALKEQFPEGVSEASLQSYLVRQNFMDRAIAPLSKAYIETCAFLEQSGISQNAQEMPDGSNLASDSDEIDEPDEHLPLPQTFERPLTKAQAQDRSPGVGPLSANDLEHLPGPGMTRAAFPLVEGTVYLTFPEGLSSDGYAELNEYLQIFLKRAQRMKRLREAQDDFSDIG